MDIKQKYNDFRRTLFEGRFRFLEPGAYETEDIYRFTKKQFPTLCDDSYTCAKHYGPSTHHPRRPVWKHQVQLALSDMKERGMLEHERNETWSFGPVEERIARKAVVKTKKEKAPKSRIEAENDGSFSFKGFRIAVGQTWIPTKGHAKDATLPVVIRWFDFATSGKPERAVIESSKTRRKIKLVTLIRDYRLADVEEEPASTPTESPSVAKAKPVKRSEPVPSPAMPSLATLILIQIKKAIDEADQASVGANAVVDYIRQLVT